MRRKSLDKSIQDTATCAICGFRGKVLGKHIQLIHNITKKEYNKLYPDSCLVCPSLRNKIKDATFKKFGSRKGIPRDKEVIQKITTSIQKTFEEGREQWSKGKQWDEILGAEKCKEIADKKRRTLQKTFKKKRKVKSKPSNLPKGVLHKKAKGGYRDDLGHYVRSRWEANICKLLSYFEISYKYEPTTFSLGCCEYTPDLFLAEFNYYIEIKGIRDSKSIQKINTFISTYPSIDLFLIEFKQYALLEFYCKDIIKGWEFAKDMSYLNKVKQFVNILRDYTLNPITREDIVQILLKDKIVNILDRTLD